MDMKFTRKTESDASEMTAQEAQQADPMVPLSGEVITPGEHYPTEFKAEENMVLSELLRPSANPDRALFDGYASSARKELYVMALIRQLLASLEYGRKAKA